MELAAAMHKQADRTSVKTPVSEVAKIVQTKDVGAIPVGKNDKLIGMVTDPVVALRVFEDGRDPAKTTAEDIETKGTVYCRTSQTMENAIHLMDQKKTRHLPDIDEKKAARGQAEPWRYFSCGRSGIVRQSIASFGGSRSVIPSAHVLDFCDVRNPEPKDAD